MKLQIRSVNTGRLRTAAGAKTNKSPISCSKNRLNEESSIPPLSRQWTPRQPVGRSMRHVWERNFLSTRTAGALLLRGSTFISAHRIRRLVVVVMTPGNGAYTRWWYCLMPGWRWSSSSGLMVLPWYYLIPDRRPNYHKIAPEAPGCAPPCQLGANLSFLCNLSTSSQFDISHSWHLLFGLFDRKASQTYFAQKGRCQKPNTCISSD